MPAYEIEVDMARLSALRRGAEMVSMPDPLLRLIEIPRDVRVNALVDAWCDEMNAMRRAAAREAPRGS